MMMRRNWRAPASLPLRPRPVWPARCPQGRVAVFRLALIRRRTLRFIMASRGAFRDGWPAPFCESVAELSVEVAETPRCLPREAVVCWCGSIAISALNPASSSSLSSLLPSSLLFAALSVFRASPFDSGTSPETSVSSDVTATFHRHSARLAREQVGNFGLQGGIPFGVLSHF
jgi:hypothetical protein